MVAWLVQRCSVSAATAREMGDRGDQVTVAPQDRRCALTGEALFDQVGHSSRSPNPTRMPGWPNKRPIGRPSRSASSPMRGAAPIGRTVDRLATPAVPAFRRSASHPDGSAARGPVRGRQELARWPGPADADASARLSTSAWRMRWSPSARPTLMGVRSPRVPHGRRTPGGIRRNRPDRRRPRRHELFGRGAGGAELDVLGPLSRRSPAGLACDAKVLVSADGRPGRA